MESQGEHHGPTIKVGNSWGLYLHLRNRTPLCASAWGAPAFIASSSTPAGRALELKASSCTGLWDGANLLSCFSALMCKLIIRHCALIKPKWCNGFAVREAWGPSWVGNAGVGRGFREGDGRDRWQRAPCPQEMRERGDGKQA